MAISSSTQREMHRRQLSREQGAVLKDPGGRLPVAIVYPNTYRIGMSNLGLHQLYRLLNNRADVIAERFFYDKPGIPVISLEHSRPLGDFPLVLFSISYELDYFNIAQLLSSAGIPIMAAERNERHPIIIAGGASIMANPAPVLSFFDAVAIGEAEVLLKPLTKVFDDTGAGREEKLRILSRVPGIIVPGHSSEPVGRRYLENLDNEPCHTAIITPDTEFGHMYMVEVERGCGRGCRFCLVNRVFSPLRFRSLDNLLQTAREGLKYCTKIGLVGPVVSAHPQAEELVRGIHELGGQVAISSLAVKPLSTGLLKELVMAGANSVTMAPEAGTLKLRKNIGKNITDLEIYEAIEKACLAGFHALKLYFMAGLPGEEEEDIVALKNLVIECGRVFKRRSLSVNIAPFVPKPFTVFEREPVLPLSMLEGRLGFLKSELSANRVKVKIESPAWSRVQAALSRGDEKLTPVIASLEKPSLTGWRRALAAAGIDEEDYLSRWPEGKKLPWEKLIEV